jgi:hypothetical protein
MRSVPMLVALALSWASPSVFAQEEAQPESTVVLTGMDARAMATDWLLLPEGGRTLGGALRFLTAEGGLGEGPLRFTDVLLVDVNGRKALGRRTEVFGGLTLLPKQPSRTGEVAWQGAQLGGRVGFAERYAASLSARVGPTLAHTGNWLTADAALEGRKSLHDTVVLQGALGAGATALRFTDGATQSQLGFGEIVADGTLIFRAPQGEAACWVGTQLRFPVATFVSRGVLEPQTRVNFRLGGVLAFINEWDILVEFSVADRGELNHPTTTLPILDGGFDQTTLTLGLTRRWQASAW